MLSGCDGNYILGNMETVKKGEDIDFPFQVPQSHKNGEDFKKSSLAVSHFDPPISEMATTVLCLIFRHPFSHNLKSSPSMDSQIMKQIQFSTRFSFGNMGLTENKVLPIPMDHKLSL